MSRPNYRNVALKIGKMASFCDIHNCFGVTDSFPVNLYCETCDGFRFYVSCTHTTREIWEVEWSDNPNVVMRKDFERQEGFNNQTEALKFVRDLVGKYSKNASV